MICNNNTRVLDFSCIGEVAQHCDTNKLCIATSEAENFDLSDLFCDSFDEINSIITEIDAYDLAVQLCNNDLECIALITVPENLEYKRNLLCGGEYLGCNNKSKKHLGVYTIWAYYAYSRYLILNGFNDTPNGSVRKTNDFSIPTPLKEVQSFADKYRTMGFESFKRTLDYMRKNNTSNTKCDCSYCTGKTSAKGYGLNGSVISRKL